jgi:hypothetical protein
MKPGKPATIDLLKSKVSFRKGLEVDSSVTVLQILMKVYGKHLLTHCLHTPPIFIKQEKTYDLVARHFSYNFLLTHAMDMQVIPAIIIDSSELENVLEVEAIDLKIILELGKGGFKTKLTPAGASRKKLKNSSMLCPLCGTGILQGPKNNRPVDDGDHKGLFKITCTHKNRKNNVCDFAAYISADEMKLFRERKLVTSEWITVIPDKCPSCPRRLVSRIQFGVEQISCEDKFREAGTCIYQQMQAEDTSATE